MAPSSGPRSPTSGAPCRRSPSAARWPASRTTPGWAQASAAEEIAAALDGAGEDVSIGGGTPFLPPVTDHVPLDPVETRTFGSRVVYERYRRSM
jgi:hypothetical protein